MRAFADWADENDGDVDDWIDALLDAADDGRAES